MNHVDFTPGWYRDRLHSTQHRQRRLGYLTAIAALITGWFVLNESRIGAARLELAKTKQDHSRIVKLYDELVALQVVRDGLLVKKRRFGTLSKILSKSVILAEIAQLIPPGVWISDLQITPIQEKRKHKKDWFEPPEFSDLEVTLNAQAESYAPLTDLVVELRSSCLFERVDHESTETVPLRSGRTVDQKTIHVFVLRAEHVET